MILIFFAILYVVCFGIYLILVIDNYFYTAHHKKIVKNCTNNFGAIDTVKLDQDRKQYIESQLIVYTLRFGNMSLTDCANIRRLNNDCNLNVIEYAEKYKYGLIKEIAHDNYSKFILTLKIIGLIIFIVCIVFLINFLIFPIK